MVGTGVLQECLDDDAVEDVLVVGRRRCGEQHAKLREVLHDDFFDYTAIQSEFADRDACFFCLGVTSVGKDEASYTRLTLDLTLAAAEALVGSGAHVTFVYVSAVGTDQSGRGPMWSRVRGRLEQKLLAMPFRAAYIFRLGYVQPLRGATSRVFLYRLAYAAVGWTYPVLRRLFPRAVTSTVAVGRAMIAVGQHGHEEHVLDAAARDRMAEAAWQAEHAVDPMRVVASHGGRPRHRVTAGCR